MTKTRLILHPYTTKQVVSLLALGLISLVPQNHAKKPSCGITTASGTLILIGVSTTDITIAADSLQSKIPGPDIAGQPKIFPISKFAACILNNIVQIGDSGDDVDFVKILQRWAELHRSASQREAYSALSEVIVKELTRFYKTHRQFPPIVVSLACVGFESGAPEVSVADFHESTSNAGFAPNYDPQDLVLIPGFFVPLGENAVSQDLLHGYSPLLTTFRDRQIVQKYRSIKNRVDQRAFATNDLIALSKTCLEATESMNGLRFDPKASAVGAPNRYAVMSQKNGFRFLSDH